MTHSPRKGVSPNWSNLPKRKCDNCGTIYRPTRPLRADQKYGFCNRDCNKQFYKHGAAFIQIKQAMEKEIAKRLLPIQSEVRELRQLWKETESRYVELAGRLDAIRMRRAS